LELFRHVQQQYGLYKALVWNRGADTLFKFGQKYLAENVEQRIDAAVKDKSRLSVPVPVLSNFLAGTFLALLKWWLDNKLVYTPERMDEMFQQLVLPGIAAVLGDVPMPMIHRTGHRGP
jgi:hypothetical protein